MGEKVVTASGKDRSIPRNLNVHKFVDPRASELEALQSIVLNRMNSNTCDQRSKRRRTSSYLTNASRKRKNKKMKLDTTHLDLAKNDKKASRKIRRRAELKMNHGIGFSTSGDGTKRLRTHVWHAKRFTMTKLWGFHLPLGLQGRGKGSRALLKWYNDGVLIHDASYYVPVQLEGPEDSLISALGMVLEPSIVSHSQDISHAIISGVIYGRAILHDIRVPGANAIAPVTYMWRPCPCRKKEINLNNHNSSVFKTIDGIDASSTSRQLWVWLHPSASSEGYDALKFACQKEMDEKNIPIYCSSLEGQLAKLEVFGSNASQLLENLLHPMTRASQNLWQLKKHSAGGPDGNSHLKTLFNRENESYIPSYGIASIAFKDPRMLPNEKTTDVQDSTSMHNPADSSAILSEDKEISKSNEMLSSSLDSRIDENSFLLENKELWDAKSGMRAPVEDTVICAARHHTRMNRFCLDEPSAEMAKDLSSLQSSSACPTLLLNENDESSTLVRWSIILPVSWVKAFWIPLITRGARAIGLRERHWIACEVGLPSFPWDFPDCTAYSRFMTKESTAVDNKAECSSSFSRSFRVPIPPPWHSVQLTLRKGRDGVESNGACTEKNMAHAKSSSIVDDANCETAVIGVHDQKLFNGIVARTSSSLFEFLNEINLGHLPLFPHGRDKKARILEYLNNKSTLDQCKSSIDRISYSSKSCFLRVILRAYKKGAFEEGAVICAPKSADLSLWTSRSADDEKALQIPESAVRHYFKLREQSPSMWELQLPENDAAGESHRWPIGFVTTGFVHGSKKPVAEGLCEATLLARLREQQFDGMFSKKKEQIYVLVRNLRSSAYRVALATVILEQKENDLESM
ncbi:Ribonucleases P/MRP protein subunit POP1 [Cucurbita argyrosperma subsp. argyrosperma]|nr:Ribonucleases P/MRP protein subunit POP1 [Cucurbita argyrosperma subsp. argyrosperma]